MSHYRIWAVLGLAIPLALTDVFAQTPEADDETVAVEQQDDVAAEEQRPRRGVRRLGDVVSEGQDEWSLDIPTIEAPVTPVESVPSVRLPDPEQDARLQSLLTRRAFNPEDPDVALELDLLLEEVEYDAQTAMQEGRFEDATRLTGVIQVLDPDRPALEELNEAVAQRGRLDTLLASAAAALEAGRLVSPADDNALGYYHEIQQIEPDHPAAVAGIGVIQERLLGEAVDFARDMDFEGAEARLELAGAVRESPEALAEARAAIADFRARQVEELQQQIVRDIDQGRFDQAEDGINQYIALGGDRGNIQNYRRSLEDARLYGGFEPGQVFSDEMSALGISAPSMVVVPAGSFMMGSPESEAERNSNEGPRFRVTFTRGFALSRTEVTVGQFARFVEATGYVTDAERAGSSRVYDAGTGRIDPRNRVTWRDDYMGDRADQNLPVIHVSWNDAAAYVQWLSRETSRDYRLPSEAEFEYALRAGSQTVYWWGDGSPSSPVENLTGDGDVSTTRRRWNVAFNRYTDGFWGPAPVGSLEPNPFGLYDMGGNVMHWVEDCWHDSYVRAPTDGTSWVNPGCSRRVLRGGSWSATPAMARSAFRLASAPDGRDARVGFRVARDL